MSPPVSATRYRGLTVAHPERPAVPQDVSFKHAPGEAAASPPMSDKIAGNQRFQLAPDIVFQRFEEEGLVVNLESGQIFSVNGTGAEIARLLADKVTINEIVDILGKDFEIDASKLEDEVRAFLRDLKKRQLITEVQTPKT